jgi:hypothetical protein
MSDKPKKQAAKKTKPVTAAKKAPAKKATAAKKATRAKPAAKKTTAMYRGGSALLGEERGGQTPKRPKKRPSGTEE